MSPALGLALLCSYLCGSIPFGLLLVRALSGRDVREVGSGNIGATNVARAAGRTAAIVTLLLDAAKGFLPTLLAIRFAPQLGTSWAGAACGVAAVLGHCFPVWLRFAGGKGVATGLGVTLSLAPFAALAGAATWLLLYAAFRISSVGSLAGVRVSLGVAAVTSTREALVGLSALGLVIGARHKGNLQRLLARKER